MPVRHVLVVDDSKSARLMLRKMLQGFGLTVDTVESAEEALNYLRSRRPDAIFMDHTMPGMDGLAAVRRIRAEPEIATIPVAMYTSKDEPAYRSEAYEAGAVDVLTKPAVPDVLGVMIERISALIDAPPPSAEVPKPAGEPAATPISGSVSAEWVEKIALEKAEMVFYNAIESQVLPLINDVVAKLRRDLENSQEGIATRICEARLAAWQPPKTEAAPPAALQAQWQPLLDERLDAFQREGQADVEKRIREVAAEICQSQLHELSERLVRQLSQRFTETSHKVVATVREAAQEAAQQAVAEAAASNTVVQSGFTRSAGVEQNLTAAAEQAAQRVWVEAQSGLRQLIYAAAGGAAAIGVGAALLATLLR